jgi:hypothetical protein
MKFAHRAKVYQFEAALLEQDDWPCHLRAGLEMERARHAQHDSARRLHSGRRGLVLFGTATATLGDGRVFELRAGDLFYIPSVPHDSWVIGEQPYVSLHFLGADRYAMSST